MKFFRVLVPLLFVLPLQAEMFRVVSVHDGRTVVIERNAAQESVRLGGVAMLDDFRAAELLRWTLTGTWVFLEPLPDGGVLLWRSPDALFVNRELVLRGYARATRRGIEPEPAVMVTYLGQVNPPLAPMTSASPQTGRTKAPKASSKTPAKPRPAARPRPRPRTKQARPQ